MGGFLVSFFLFGWVFCGFVGRVVLVFFGGGRREFVVVVGFCFVLGVLWGFFVGVFGFFTFMDLSGFPKHQKKLEQLLREKLSSFNLLLN